MTAVARKVVVAALVVGAVLGMAGVAEGAEYKVHACGASARYLNHLFTPSVSHNRMETDSVCPTDDRGHNVGVAARAGVDTGPVPVFANATQSFIAPAGTTIQHVHLKADGRSWNGDWVSLLQGSRDRFESSFWNLSGCTGNPGSTNGCVSAIGLLDQDYEMHGATGIRSVVACAHVAGCTTYSTDSWPFTRAYYFIREFYKVSAADVDGPAGEPFAIAATRPLTPLVTPQPTTALTLEPSAPMPPNTSVTVTATVANPSPDLSAENATVTLSLPAGVQLLDGEETQHLGALNTKGSSGDSAVASWTVRGTSAGLKQLIASSEASRYGSLFHSSAVAGFTVSTTPPVVTVEPPPTSTPTPTPPPRPEDRKPTAGSPKLTITRAQRRGSRLIVRGTVARGVTGKLAATWTIRARRHRYVARASTYARSRKYTMTIKLPRRRTTAKRGILVVRYGGGGGFTAQARRKAISLG
jgi:hypothetical protein